MALTIKHRVTLDLSLGSVQATVPFRKGDGPVHEVIFCIRNGCEAVGLPVGTMAAICIYNGANDGDGVVDLCTVDHVNHTISYIPRQDALSVAGSVRCDLRIIGADGGALGSPKFIFFVDDTMADVTEAEVDKALRASDSWGVIQSARANALAAEASREAAEESARKAAEAAATFDINFTNGEGEGSIVQKNGGVTGSNGVSVVADAKAAGVSATALSARTEANGDASLAQGYNSKANTKADVALGSSQAGLTEAEFNTLYPNGYLLSGNYLNYEQFKKRVVNAAFSCGNGIAKGAYSFASGTNVAGRGSQAQGSATFGNNCVVREGYFDSDSGPLLGEGENSLAGGDTVAIHGPNSIGYGFNLILPKRSDANGNLIPIAVFGRYNKYYHPTYTTIFEVGNGTSNDVAGLHNAFEILLDGRTKVFGAPTEDNDVVRLGDLKALSDALGRLNDGGVA